MRIVIRNFGPIKEADIETGRYTVFIGQTSTGKSVAAKLISIANDVEFMLLGNDDFQGFNSLLKQYAIDYPFQEQTIIRFFNKKASWTISKDEFKLEGSIDPLWANVRALEIDNQKIFLETYKDVIGKKDDGTASRILREGVLAKIKGEDIDISNLTEFQQKMLYMTVKQSYTSNTHPVYIPAERMLLSIFTNNLYQLLGSDMTIPESIRRFGSLYGIAKERTKDFPIDFANIKVQFSKDKDVIHVVSDDVDIEFSQASSGLQSIIPMWLVFCDTQYGFGRYIIIEEPELNLFPTLQVNLITKMVETNNATPNSLVITTHSPYILSAFDNLIYANDVYYKADDTHKKEVTSLVDTKAMIDFDDVTAYHFADNGIVTSIKDFETRSTGSYALDEASGETSQLFNELLAIDNEL